MDTTTKASTTKQAAAASGSPLPRATDAAWSYSLVNRVLLIAFLLLASAVAALGSLFVQEQNKLALSSLERNLSSELAALKVHALLSTSELSRSTLFLAATPPIQGMIRAQQHGGIDPVGNTPVDVWVTRLQTIFSAFMDQHPDYYQMRFIGFADDAKELVRVDRIGGIARAKPGEQLQHNPGRDYIDNARTLRRGEVYFSRIDLNIEQSEFAPGNLRTLRASTPVFDTAGNPFGVVVVNMNVGNHLDAIAAQSGFGKNLLILDERGQFLLHPEASKAFAFARGQTSTLETEHPEVYAALQRGNAHKGSHSVATPDGLVHMETLTVHFDPRTPERYVRALFLLPEKTLQLEQSGTLQTTLWLSLLVMLIAGTMVVVIVQRAFQPLTRMADWADKRLSGAAPDLPLATRCIETELIRHVIEKSISKD